MSTDGRLSGTGKGGEGGMEVGGEGDCIPVTSWMTPVLRWAVTRAILMFNCEGQSHKTVSTDHNI